MNPANDHSLQGQIYMDLAYHQGCHDRIAAIAMGRGTLDRVIVQDNYAVHMVQTYRDNVDYQLFGYKVVIMNEIPDGEWLVVCEDRPIDFIKRDFKWDSSTPIWKKLVIDS